MGNGGGESAWLGEYGVAAEGGDEGLVVGSQGWVCRKHLNATLPVGHPAGDAAPRPALATQPQGAVCQASYPHSNNRVKGELIA